MDALDKKLLRDFARLWAQALAIALVLACGVMVLVMSLGMSKALDDTRAAYYERNAFADIFAQARRAPLSLMPEIRAIPGVADAEARISDTVILAIPGRTETSVGQVLSLPEDGTPRLNRPILRAGFWPDAEATDQVVVNAPFAEAHGFVPGDTFEANLNGRKRTLTITGTALSPEFIYTIGPGALMPDNEAFGILWMPRRAAASAFDMTGAFDSVTLALVPGADPERVIERLDRILEPYGGMGAYGRDQQISHSFVDAEINQLKTLTYILPPVFLGITVFLVNMVIGRIIALERSEIGLLKAIGYSDVEICVHYLMLAGLIAVVGIAVGAAMGAWFAHAMAELYAEFFDFPYLVFSVSWGAYVIAGLLGLAAAVLGALRSALKAAWMPPAVAMQPPAPPRYRRGVIDRVLARLRISQPTMMILRSILRYPLRAGFTTLGMALAVSVLVAANFFTDSLDKIIRDAFDLTNRQDTMLVFTHDLPVSALEDVRRLPGVLQAEGQMFHTAVLRHGPREERVGVEARRPGGDLSRIVDADGRIVEAPPGGVMLSERLADNLDAAVGDVIEVEFLTGNRESFDLPVTRIVTQYFGLGAYMDADFLDSLFRQAPRMTTANITVDPARSDALHAELKQMPALGATIMMTDNRRSFEDTIAENVLIVTTIYASLGILITVGVAYNGARVQLSERARELASLRILGFTRAEVSYILVGETMILALLAQPLGWWIGATVARGMTDSFSSDLYAIPLVLEPATFAYASLIVLGSAAGSALLVRRRIDRLDLVAVMKTRE